PKERQSRGLLLAPDVGARKVTLVRQYVNPARRLLASSQGNMLALPGGRWLLGYGWLPNFTEYAAAGRVLLDGTLGRHVQSFKTTLSPWHGQPADAPGVAVRRTGPGQATVLASWNGATDVASWRVLSGPSPGSLAPVASAPRSGFETSIPLAAAAPYVAVQALDGSGAL